MHRITLAAITDARRYKGRAMMGPVKKDALTDIACMFACYVQERWTDRDVSSRCPRVEAQHIIALVQWVETVGVGVYASPALWTKIQEIING